MALSELKTITERRSGLAGQRSPITLKVLGSIPNIAVSMQFGVMLKMEVLCAWTCPLRTQKFPVPYPSKDVWLSPLS